MIIANNISLAFGTQKVFDKVAFTLNQRQRIGLVGRNGSGKSTLLEVIAGMQQLDSGAVSIDKQKTVAYLPQEVVLDSKKSILEETLTAFEGLFKLTEELKKLESIIHDDPANEQALERYAEIHEAMRLLNPESAEAEAKKMLMGLGFKTDQFAQSVATLSVGWRMRIVLCKLLLQKADFYLFDEPTNHLDIFAKDWFLEFLEEADFGFMLVCHERYFLDKVCGQILELEMSKGKMYNGNYSTYEIQKEHDLQLLESSYQLQQKEIARKKATIDRFKASASRAKQAQSMVKQLDKIELIQLPPSLKTISFNFPPITQSGKSVLKIENIAQKFNQKEIFKNVSFEVERGQKIAVIAANGVGKSTLFNIIASKLPLQQGTVTFGHNVSHALFDQDQNAVLSMNNNIIENISALCPKATMQTIRMFLGAFLFKNEDVGKKINVLSGGEKNRVGIIRVLLQNANFLFLDEPTNHLDIPSKEILLKALQNYTGTVLFVSHDHSFINSLATRIIELTPEGVHSFDGNYDGYLYYKKYLESQKKSGAQSSTSTAKGAAKEVDNKMPTLYDLNKKNGILEKKIKKLELDVETISYQFGEFDYGSAEFTNAENQLNDTNKMLKSTMAEWELLQKEILKLTQ